MKRCRSGVMVHTSTCGKKKTPRANPERTWRCSALQNTNCRTNATRGKKDQRAKLTRPTARAGEAGTTAERFSSIAWRPSTEVLGYYRPPLPGLNAGELLILAGLNAGEPLNMELLRQVLEQYPAP